MANVLQLKRGTTTRRLTYTPAPGELVVDLTQNKLYYGNGTTVGGVPVEAEDSSKVSKVLPLSTAQAYRDVASFHNSGAAATGAIVIHLPASKNTANTMMQIKIKGYNNLTSTGAFELLCGFYQNNSSNISQFSAALLGSFPSDQVRYAKAADHTVIILGDVDTTWAYPNIHIPEVVCSYSDHTGWEDGWSITLETDLSAYTVKATPTVYGGPRAKTADVLTTARTIGGVSFNGSANINLPGVNTAGNQSTTGNAATATRLATARTFTYTGDVTGSVSFNGSANVSAAMTLANSGVTAGTYKSVTVDAKGRVTAGTNVVTSLVTSTSATGTTNAATTNTNTFLNIVEKVGTANASPGTSTQVTGAGTVTVTSDTAGKLTITGAQSITGNAATATKLETARTINGIAFDGTSDITINAATLSANTFNGTQKIVGDLEVTGRLLLGVGFEKNLSGYGYQKLPSGLILQWGEATESVYATDYRFFPIQFPNAAHVVIAQLNHKTINGYTANDGTVVGIVDNTKFLFVVGGPFSGGGGVGFWIAIGS